MLSISSSFLQRAAPRARAALFSTIPVEHVARVMRMHVGDEETALKADAVFQRALGEIKAEYGGNGGVSATRTVCKSEWEYEVEMVFELEAFQSYMVSFGHFMMWGPLPLAFLCLNIAGF